MKPEPEPTCPACGSHNIGEREGSEAALGYPLHECLDCGQMELP